MCNQSKKVGVECVIFEIMGSGVKYKAKKGGVIIQSRRV